MRRRDPEIRSPSSRVRYIHPDEHGTIRANSPIQMLEVDGVKHALTLLWARRAEWGTALPINIVHDEVIFEADEADAPRIVQLLRDCLEAGMARVLTRVTPRMDITTGPTWAESDQTGG